MKEELQELFKWKNWKKNIVYLIIIILGIWYAWYTYIPWLLNKTTHKTIHKTQQIKHTTTNTTKTAKTNTDINQETAKKNITTNSNKNKDYIIIKNSFVKIYSWIDDKITNKENIFWTDIKVDPYFKKIWEENKSIVANSIKLIAKVINDNFNKIFLNANSKIEKGVNLITRKSIINQLLKKYNINVQDLEIKLINKEKWIYTFDIKSNWYYANETNRIYNLLGTLALNIKWWYNFKTHIKLKQGVKQNWQIDISSSFKDNILSYVMKWNIGNYYLKGNYKLSNNVSNIENKISIRYWKWIIKKEVFYINNK